MGDEIGQYSRSEADGRVADYFYQLESTSLSGMVIGETIGSDRGMRRGCDFIFARPLRSGAIAFHTAKEPDFMIS